MLREFPVEMIERAVWGMLPKGRLGRSISKKLFVYADEKHEQEAQKPVVLDLSK
jgi:large subunit ribosomal protein L13